MRVESKEIEYCKLSVMYEGDPDVVQKKRQEAIIELRKNATIPGFRKGRCPDHILKVKLKKQLDNFIAREMTTQAFDDVIFETKAKAIGYPQFSNLQLNKDIFSCEMTFMKKPDFELATYKGLQLKKPEFNRDVDSQADKMLMDIRLKFGEVNPFSENDFLEQGDSATLNITYDASRDTDPENQSFTQEGILYTVGENRWPGVDDNILGMKAGEDRQFDGPKGELGKYSVLVHMGMKKVPCEITDELAQKVGLANVEELKEKAKSVVADQLKNLEAKMVRQELAAKLVESNVFEVPATLSSLEAQSLAMQQQTEWKNLSNEQKEMFIEMAKKNIKLSFILDSVRDVEPEAVLNETEARNAIKARVASSGQDPEKFLVEAQKTGQLAGVISSLRDEFTLQWIIEHSNIEEHYGQENHE